MSEHRHNWHVCKSRSEEITAFCEIASGDPICTWVMDEDEIERRLNATECLSAENAKSQAIEHDCMDDKFRSDLLNYADVREDKD